MGVEIGKSSLEKIFSPEVTTFSWMAGGHSLPLHPGKAVDVFLQPDPWPPHRLRRHGGHAADSLSDSISTGVVLLSTLISHFLHVQVDGFAGLLVAVFILKTGWDSARETLDPLLGRPMDPSLAADIDRLVLSHPTSSTSTT